MFELLLIGVIPWIHANFFHDTSSEFGGIRCEVNIGNEWCVIAFSSQLTTNVFEILSFFDAWSSNPNQLASRLNHSDTLRYSSSGIECIGGSHRLQSNGIIAPKSQISNHHFACAEAFIRSKAITIDWNLGQRNHAGCFLAKVLELYFVLNR